MKNYEGIMKKYVGKMKEYEGNFHNSHIFNAYFFIFPAYFPYISSYPRTYIIKGRALETFPNPVDGGGGLALQISKWGVGRYII